MADETYSYNYWGYKKEERIHHQPVNPFFHDLDIGSYIYGDSHMNALNMYTRMRTVSFTTIRMFKMLNEACTVLRNEYNIYEQVCVDAANYLRKLKDSRIRGGWKTKLLVSLYTALNNHCFPVYYLKDVESILGMQIDREIIAKISKIARKKRLVRSCTSPSLLAVRYFNWLSRQLGSNDCVRNCFSTLCGNVFRSFFGVGVVGGCFYVCSRVCCLGVTERLVADALGVVEASVRSGIQRLVSSIQYRCGRVYEWRTGSPLGVPDTCILCKSSSTPEIDVDHDDKRLLVIVGNDR